MLKVQGNAALAEIRTQLREHILCDEDAAVRRLAGMVRLERAQRDRASAEAAALVKILREDARPGLMEVFLAEYGLTTREGVSLMCLAEALLRVPDEVNIDALIRDKIAPADWARHVGHSSSPLVNASTWGLMLTGKVISEGKGGDWDVLGTLHGVVRRLGEPVIRRAVHQAMGVLGHQFVLGRNIGEALSRARDMEAKGYGYSYDMLGEAARTADDARQYFLAYANAIGAIAEAAVHKDVRLNPGISVKLSALHPRYEAAHHSRVMEELVPRLTSLALYAKNANMGLNVDAEEADRLDLSLDVIEAVLRNPELKGWDGFGVVVQAYGPRASYVLDWLYALAQNLERRLMVRLVKGAYWDTEIKRAQVLGLAGYPVFTRKVSTDVSYMACAQKLFDYAERLYPQFATHNAHTAAAVLELAQETGVGADAYEFQRLHGMGEALHDQLCARHGTRCRIYAPVGVHEDLLAYLVRRLLENGANSSFVNQVLDEEVEAERIVRDPVSVLADLDSIPNPRLPKPEGIFGAERRNAKGWDVTDPVDFAALDDARSAYREHVWRAGPIIEDERLRGVAHDVLNPANVFDMVGQVEEGDEAQAVAAVAAARAAQPDWEGAGADMRAQVLERTADLYEANAPELMAIAQREAGKSLPDAIAEVREAVDFCRFYAGEARRYEADGGWRARGVFVCISPWNFPLAIFTGQIAAALAAGNAVIAKPAEQTALMAARAVELMHQAGVPGGVLNFVPGRGEVVGRALTGRADIDGVCFTGGTDTAQAIHTALADAGNVRAPLIAETGGLNAMVVDSTALPEQAVRDIVASAFQSAGQRCSALRLLCVQRDVAPKVIGMLKGAMDELVVGDPWDLASDVGPVVDVAARDAILDHCRALDDAGALIHKVPLRDMAVDGTYVAPVAYRLEQVADLKREVFGPVLHVVEFDVSELGALIDAINATGYGLTFGLHTRIDQRVEDVAQRVHVGNAYVNRNQIGAVVGSQPFGGEGLSGTGPKAGGPYYLGRFLRDGGQEEGIAPGTSSKGEIDAGRLGQVVAQAQAALAGWADAGVRCEVLTRAAEALGEPIGHIVMDAVTEARALPFAPRDLPGPTGESNQLRVAPRGVFLALGGADLRAVVRVLACGNACVCERLPEGLQNVLVEAGMPASVLQDLGAAIGDDALQGVAGIAGVCADGDARAVRRALVRRPGDIVTLICDGGDMAAFVHERALCVDVTATGGNAALLALVGDEP